METIAFGLTVLMLLAFSGCCLHGGKFVWGVVCGGAALPLICLTAALWNDLLAESGKDTALLGWERYPAAVVILAALLLAAVILVVGHMVGIVKQNKSRKNPPKP